MGRCKISPSGIILNGLTLNLSALNDQALPDKRGLLPRLQGTVPHSPLTWIPGIKTICKHFETVHIYVNILILQKQNSNDWNQLPAVWFPSERVHSRSLPFVRQSGRFCHYDHPLRWILKLSQHTQVLIPAKDLTDWYIKDSLIRHLVKCHNQV